MEGHRREPSNHAERRGDGVRPQPRARLFQPDATGHLTVAALPGNVAGAELAGMELKDYQQLNFKGQSLILDLNATGVSYIVICREKDETETKLVNGSSVSVSTGRKIPDGFKGQEYNVGGSRRCRQPAGEDRG